MNKTFCECQRLVEAINCEFDKLHTLSNDELRSKLSNIEQVIKSSENKELALDKFLVPVYAIVKETALRFSKGDVTVTASTNDCHLFSKGYDFIYINGDNAVYKNRWDVNGVPYIWNMVHFDEQLLGGILLHYGYATEMATGEGKTLVATLPVFLNALTHKGVHLMTVNDYLSKRDFLTTRPIYMFHGLSVDCIEFYGRHDHRRKEAYKLDISFGTNSSFTFDYLHDHLAVHPNDCVQQGHYYAIIDELDSILIDDADTPHIVGSGNYYSDEKIYKENLPIIKELVEQENVNLFKSDKLRKSASLTEKGRQWIAEKKGIPDLYSYTKAYEIPNYEHLTIDEQKSVGEKFFLQNVLHQLLLSLTVYERDEDYIVDKDKITIIDQHTGRLKKSNRWEYGLHTAMEVKENVKVQSDIDSTAVISLKNYFKLYDKIAGMSGTILLAQDELNAIYNLQCASVPTHKPNIRVDYPTRVFRTSKDKNKAIIEAIIKNLNNGRPTLVGCVSVKRSEEICSMLDERRIEYNKLNAKTLEDEAAIVAKAGWGNTITVATSVAGRGTDIKPSSDAIAKGGLMIIGTDLFESQRVDKQLRGRSGRQGNPGSSEFFTSLDDSILNNLKKEDLSALRSLAEEHDGCEISCDSIWQYFEKAQANREAYFKKCRKETARKDDIIAPQRKKFYDQRNAVLFSRDFAENLVDELILLYKENNIYDINDNLRFLYYQTCKLATKIRNSNPDKKNAWFPYAENMQPFAISLEINPALNSFEYFSKEFKRQVILQMYDLEWKQFVLYMMGDLDRKEIAQLDKKYSEMIRKTHHIILFRLQNAKIIYEDKKGTGVSDISSFTTNLVIHKTIAHIQPDAPCPCKSGKQYRECHGRNILCMQNIHKRRN